MCFRKEKSFPSNENMFKLWQVWVEAQYTNVIKGHLIHEVNTLEFLHNT